MGLEEGQDSSAGGGVGVLRGAAGRRTGHLPTPFPAALVLPPYCCRTARHTCTTTPPSPSHTYSCCRWGKNGRQAGRQPGDGVLSCTACTVVSSSCTVLMLLPPLPMQGGYKAFWKAFPDVCEGGYVPMDHPQYTEQLKVGGWVGRGVEGGLGQGILRWAAFERWAACRRWPMFCPDPLAALLLPFPGVPQRCEKGVGADHSHVQPQAAAAAAQLLPAAEHGGCASGCRQQQGGLNSGA